MADKDKMNIKWPTVPVPKAGATVGERVEYSITQALRNLFNTVDGPLAELLSWPLRLFIHAVEDSTAGYLRPVLDQAIGQMDPGDPFRQLLVQLRDPTGEGAAGLLMGMGASAGSAGLMSVFEPAFERWRQNAYLGDPTKLPDPLTLLQLSARGKLTSGQLDEWFQRQGYRKEYAAPLWEVMRPRVAVGELAALTQRKIQTPEQFIAELQKRGYPPEDAQGLSKLLHIIPNVPDLIRMAVREAFTPDVVARFQLHAEFPAEFADAAELLGLDREWSLRYWAAHWELPSVTMGFEMFHRGIMSGEELDLLLKTLDISPYWRAKLRELSFNPLTRVDVRRMYSLGVLDERRVYQSYLDLGYNPENAEAMTQFTVALYQEEQREGTRADVIAGYREGVLTREEAATMLRDLRYPEWIAETYLVKADHAEEAERRQEETERNKGEVATERELSKADIVGGYEDGILTRDEASTFLAVLDYSAAVVEVILARADYRIASTLLKEELTAIKTLYVNREIEKEEVHSRLNALRLPSTQSENLLAVWTIERERKVERPSVSKLEEFYTRGIIDATQLKDQLGKQGYLSEYVGWYVQAIDIDVLDAAKREAERIIKEQERELLSAFRDDRRVALNQLDVTIQEYRVYIAEAKVSARFTEDAEVKADIADSIAESLAEIERLQLEKLLYPVVPA